MAYAPPPLPPGPDPYALLASSMPGAVEQVRALLHSLPCPMPGLPPQLAALVDCSLLQAARNAPMAPWLAVDPRLLPPAVDHRAFGLVGPVRDQGQVGSCTANAVASIYDTAARRAGRQQLYGSALHIFATYQEPGVDDYLSSLKRPSTSEAVWPYAGGKACAFEDDDTRWSCASYYGTGTLSGYMHPAAIAERQRADAWPAFQATKVELMEASRDLNQLAAILATGEPLMVAVNMASNWMMADYAGEVLPPPQGYGGPHALVLRGYRIGPYGREWLVQNSWGTQWGRGGFVYIPERSLLATLEYSLRFTVRVLG